MESGKGDTGLSSGPPAAAGIATSAVGVAGAPGSVGVNVCAGATGVGVASLGRRRARGVAVGLAQSN